jgi:hypothetical protein
MIGIVMERDEVLHIRQFGKLERVPDAAMTKADAVLNSFSVY